MATFIVEGFVALLRILELSEDEAILGSLILFGGEKGKQVQFSLKLILNQFNISEWLLLACF